MEWVKNQVLRIDLYKTHWLFVFLSFPLLSFRPALSGQSLKFLRLLTRKNLFLMSLVLGFGSKLSNYLTFLTIKRLNQIYMLTL